MTIENTEVKVDETTPVETVTEEQVAPEAAKEETVEKDAAPQGEPAKTPVDEWKPNFKFKVRDTEHEFDDVIKKVVSKDNQEKIKELYEKAFGLDYAKKRMDKYDADFKAIEPRLQREEQQTQFITRMDKMLQEKDFTSFQKTLQIPDDMVLNRAIEILKEKEMSPEERHQLEQAHQKNARLYSLEQENMTYQQSLQMQAYQSKMQQLNAYLSQPTMAKVVSDFDARMGRSGAFQDEVIARGQLAYSQRKVDLTPEQAAREVLAIMGINPESLAGQASPASTAAQSAATEPEPKPTLPNIKAGSKSPTGRKVFKSIDELRQAANAAAELDNN